MVELAEIDDIGVHERHVSSGALDFKAAASTFA